jgi:hypothetical protein
MQYAIDTNGAGARMRTKMAPGKRFQDPDSVSHLRPGVEWHGRQCMVGKEKKKKKGIAGMGGMGTDCGYGL